MDSLGAKARLKLFNQVVDARKLEYVSDVLGVDEERIAQWIVFSLQMPSWFNPDTSRHREAAAITPRDLKEAAWEWLVEAKQMDARYLESRENRRQIPAPLRRLHKSLAQAFALIEKEAIERAAKVAEQYTKVNSHDPDPEYKHQQFAALTAEVIAEAIRSLSP